MPPWDLRTPRSPLHELAKFWGGYHSDCPVLWGNINTSPALELARNTRVTSMCFPFRRCYHLWHRLHARPWHSDGGGQFESHGGRSGGASQQAGQCPAAQDPLHWRNWRHCHRANSGGKVKGTTGIFGTDCFVLEKECVHAWFTRSSALHTLALIDIVIFHTSMHTCVPVYKLYSTHTHAWMHASTQTHTHQICMHYCQ